MYSVKIADLMQLALRIREEYAKIEVNEILPHRVLENVVKHINLFI